MSKAHEGGWTVYILHCTDDTYYTGITNNLEQRLRQHGNGTGAKYFRGRKPTAVVYAESVKDRSEATRREAAIKKLSRAEKLRLIGVSD